MISINSNNFPQGSSLPLEYKHKITQSKFRAMNWKFWLMVKTGLIVWMIWYVISPFMYLDLSTGCFIKIYPSLTEFNNRTIKNSISIIKKTHPVEYNRICSQVKTINPNIGCGGIHGGCFYANQPDMIYVNTPVNNIAITSMVIVHETCHLYQHLGNKPVSEEECYEVGDKLIKNIVVY